MTWTDQDIEAVREAMKKQEEIIRPKLMGLEKLIEILKIEEVKDATK